MVLIEDKEVEGLQHCNNASVQSSKLLCDCISVVSWALPVSKDVLNAFNLAV